MGLLDSLTGGGSDSSGDIKKYHRKARKDLKPYRKLGKWAIPQAKETDITGGAGEFLNKMKTYGQDFQVNPDDPMFKFRMDQGEKGVNRFMASRGLYNSRAGLNVLQDTGQRISAEESQGQYQRGYGQLMDSFNMATTLGRDKFSKLYNLLGIGSGAAGTSASQAMQTGANLSSSQMAQGQSRTNFISDLMGMGTNLASLWGMGAFSNGGMFSK